MELRISYYPDITQYIPALELHSAVEAFGNIFEHTLKSFINNNVSIRVLDVVSVSDQVRLMVENECEIGLIKPVAYVFAHQENDNIIPGAVARRMIDGRVGDTYFAQVYARVDTGIISEQDLKNVSLRGYRLAFGDPFSTSNFLVPASSLLSKGIHPFTSFKSITYFGGHDKTAEAVYHGEADIGAGHDGVIWLLAEREGFEDAESKLKQIFRTDIHSDPVAINIQDKQLRNAVIAALHKSSENPQMQEALNICWGGVKSLGPTKHENYASIESALNILNLTANDMLKEG